MGDEGKGFPGIILGRRGERGGIWGPEEEEEEERRRDLSCGKIEGLKRKAEEGTCSVVVYVLATYYSCFCYANWGSFPPPPLCQRRLHRRRVSVHTGTQKKEI